jgi:hypothetical protein
MFGLTSAALLAACSLTTSFDDLSNGGAALADGGPNADAPSTGNETGAGGDASTPPLADGGGADSGPSVPYCQTVVPAPTFCDDFERSDVNGVWTNEVLGAGGQLAIEPSTRTAQGRELHATIPFFTGGGISNAHLSRDLAAATAVTVSYALRIDSAPPQGVQQAMNVRILYDGGEFAATYLYIHPDGVTFVEQTFPQDASTMSEFLEHALAHPIVFGTWQRVTVTTTLGASPRHTGTIDGAVAYDAPADPFFRTGRPQIAGGIDYSGAPTGPLSLRVDDLYVSLTN